MGCNTGLMLEEFKQLIDVRIILFVTYLKLNIFSLKNKFKLNHENPLFVNLSNKID